MVSFVYLVFIKKGERLRPVKRFRNTGPLVELLLPKRSHDAGYLFGKGCFDIGDFRQYDLPFALGGRIVDKMIQAAALERIVQLANTVGRNNDNGLVLGLHRAHFRYGDLEIGKYFKQKGLELLISPVNLIDQEHHLFLAAHGLKQWPGDEKFLGKNIFNMARGAADIEQL